MKRHNETMVSTRLELTAVWLLRAIRFAAATSMLVACGAGPGGAPDTTPPDVNAPLPNHGFPSPAFTLSVTARDNIRVTRIDMVAEDGTLLHSCLPCDATSSPPGCVAFSEALATCTWTVHAGDLRDGPHVVTYRVLDAVGNVGTATYEFYLQTMAASPPELVGVWDYSISFAGGAVPGGVSDPCTGSVYAEPSPGSGFSGCPADPRGGYGWITVFTVDADGNVSMEFQPGARWQEPPFTMNGHLTSPTTIEGTMVGAFFSGQAFTAAKR